jgi:ABC-type sugar transport system substrate-binding protein
MYQMAIAEQNIRFPNVKVDYKDAEYDPSKQVTLIEEAITQGYDCIFLECMDPVGVNDAIRKAEAAGIPVISTNAAEPSEIHTLHIAGADYSSGWAGGEALNKLSTGQANRTAIVLDCPAEQKPGARMGTGFEEYVATTDIKLLESIGIAEWSMAKAQDAMREMLTKYPAGQITMVYCASGDIANGAMNAIEQAGRQNEGILIWGFMGYPNELEAIKDGKMAGTMFSDTWTQYAALFYYAMYFIATGLTSVTAGYTATPMVEQPMIPVTQANVDEIMAVSHWYYNP